MEQMRAVPDTPWKFTSRKKSPRKRPSLCTQPAMARNGLVSVYLRGGCNGLGCTQIARDFLVGNLVHHQLHRLARSARVEVDGVVDGPGLLFKARVVDVHGDGVLVLLGAGAAEFDHRLANVFLLPLGSQGEFIVVALA